MKNMHKYLSKKLGIVIMIIIAGVNVVSNIKNIQEIIINYVQDYNQKLNKNLLVNEDFFGDTLRLIDFLNNYYTYLVKSKDEERILNVLDHFELLRKEVTGLELPSTHDVLSYITEDEYRQMKKGVYKVRKMILPLEEKENILKGLSKSYELYENAFKDQLYMVYTNDNIHNFELKERYFPHVIGLNLENQTKDVDTLDSKEIEYYQGLPFMLETMTTKKGLSSLDQYERKNYHSLFNYSYLKTKNLAFFNFSKLTTPMLVVNSFRKIESNVKTNTFFATPIQVGKKSAYSVVGFHENSKFSDGFADSDIHMKDSKKVKGDMGITTAIFRKNKLLPPHHFELIKLFTVTEQIHFIDEILENEVMEKAYQHLKQYQNRLKRSLCDQLSLEYQLKGMISTKTI